MFEWFSMRWFSPAVLADFVWEQFFYLYFLPIVPFLFFIRRLGNIQVREKVKLNLPKKYLKRSPERFLRFVLPTCIGLCLCLVLVALARPQKISTQIEQNVEGIDIVLITDISVSMLLEDLTPNRLNSAKKVAQEFIKGRINDRIGLVVFAGEAYSLSPLTSDYNLLDSYLQNLKVGDITEQGTAIGSALGVAINRFQDSQAKSKVIILISDGDNTAGSLDPLTASQLAQYYNIKIHSIMVGTEGEVPARDTLTGKTTMISQTADETVLRKIAELGKGKFFRVQNNNALTEVFKEIDKLEKSTITEKKFQTKEDFYGIYLTWALLFYLMWIALKSSFLHNILED